VHGFCYTVHKEVIDRVGYFDEEVSPRGYGEENDYSFRAEDAGFGLAIALESYVFHRKSGSYPDELRLRLTQEGEQSLVARYGPRRRARAISYMEGHPSLATMRAKAKENWPEHEWSVG
jgi:hypothetical protein